MLENGTLLQDRFLIEERIGVGGMGAVYLATDQKFGSRVAIKQTFYDDVELAQQFEREARLLNALHHPVLPHVSDFFSEGDAQLLVMEYIEGEDLSEILKRGDGLAIEDIVRWTIELLDALDYLHSQEPPIVHRDIKPNNLKITPRRNVVLLDFGLAKETSGNTLEMRSVFGYSRNYSPLEQIEGTVTDPRCDIFSLGATVFHLLAAEPPIDALARASAIVAGAPDPLRLASDVNPNIPAAFAKVIRSAMSLNSIDRYQTAQAMRAAVESAVSPDMIAAVSEETVAEPVSTVAASESSEIFTEIPHVAAKAAIPLETLSSTIVSPPVEVPVLAPDLTMARSRTRPTRGWLKPALAAAFLVLIGFAATAAYLSSGSASGSVDNVVEAPPPASEDSTVGGHENTPAAIGEESAVVAQRTSQSKPVKPQPSPAAKKAEVESPEPPEPERPRIVKPAPQTRKTAPNSDQPYVSDIEKIFTGSSPEGQRRNDISDEERARRKRIRQMRRDGRLPPF